ncbi:phosphoadenosine phosphosulfate reductase family protein [Pontibacter sp. FD36]|uniref:phosphoadenosine phosphosulfate reductase domain-containing protein n=1 Tax=Pontibacter sp. FD36 TaxID=2789860 RepID=UPI0018A92B32|nr:phosphoadenosine phosphosulfate reductase family protein [Pontibacter sp. FD36]MBF8961916.1 phosphoadenosine phosphosulfate reductase family protein [Pontibacter sp. FD36]
MKFCTNCLTPVLAKDQNSIEIIKQEYLKDYCPWYLGYSGGKDSSALLKLVIIALSQINSYHKDITVIYCDTGVENPIITDYVYQTFESLKLECTVLGLPIRYRIAVPNLEDRFFVKVIGRGYPTPTNIFRWCTDKLRINPVKQIIDKHPKATVLLGIRNGESEQRDRTISKHSKSEYYLTQSGSSKNQIFSPIIHHSIKDVWATLMFNDFPQSIDGQKLGKLYKDAGSECPVYRELPGKSCGSSRFGCWTCTVVRKDKSIFKMIENGYAELTHLHEFRNWISEFRDNQEYRCKRRRNGQLGLGPFTIQGRKIILDKLLEAESKSGVVLIQDEEIKRIKELWEIDLNNPNYIE